MSLLGQVAYCMSVVDLQGLPCSQSPILVPDLLLAVSTFLSQPVAAAPHSVFLIHLHLGF